MYSKADILKLNPYLYEKNGYLHINSDKAINDGMPADLVKGQENHLKILNEAVAKGALKVNNDLSLQSIPSYYPPDTSSFYPPQDISPSNDDNDDNYDNDNNDNNDDDNPYGITTPAEYHVWGLEGKSAKGTGGFSSRLYGEDFLISKDFFSGFLLSGDGRFS